MNAILLGAGMLAGLGVSMLTRGSRAPQTSRMRAVTAQARGRGRAKADARTCLIIGRDHKHYPFGPYRVCLTKTQRATLFGRENIQEIGCGTFACAYDHPAHPGKVVKLTRDDEDLGGLHRAQGTGLVPTMYAAYELREGGRAVHDGRKTRVYAAVLDRLQSPAARGEHLSREEADALQYAVSDMLSPEAACCTRGTCNDLCLRIANVGRRLHAHGVDWLDTHEGNVGYDVDGNLRVLDVGRSEVPAPPLPVLAGRRRRQRVAAPLRRVRRYSASRR